MMVRKNQKRKYVRSRKNRLSLAIDPYIDYGTKELQFKHQCNETFEPIDLLLARELINHNQHGAARYFCYLHWLYHGNTLPGLNYLNDTIMHVSDDAQHCLFKVHCVNDNDYLESCSELYRELRQILDSLGIFSFLLDILLFYSYRQPSDVLCQDLGSLQYALDTMYRTLKKQAKRSNV